MSPTARGAQFFATDHLHADLRGRSVRGGAITLASQGASFILNMIAVAILARLLTPADFGLIAMVTAITGFVALFKDAGLSLATVQRARITHEQVSTLFWVNILLSLFMLVFVCALSPLIAWFYSEPRLIYVTIALAGTFLFGGVTVQHQALLRRQMRFNTLAIISIAAMAGSIIAAILAAWAGLGYWSLIIQGAMFAAVTAAGVWIACPWRPGLPVRGSGVRPMLAFGGHLTGATFLGYLSRNMDDVLIGRFWGAGPLGFYSKAYQILLLPILQINIPMSSVALPALSRLQDKPERFKSFYFEAIGLMVFVGMPIVAFLFAEARPVVLLVLGPKWLPSVPIFQALAAAAFMGTIGGTTGWVYVALGQTARQLRWSLISVPITLTGFVIGLHWGPVGVGLAYSITQCTLLPLSTLYCYKGTFLRFRDLVITLGRPALISLAAAGVVILSNQWPWIPSPRPIVQIFICGVIYTAAYVLGWMITPGTRRSFFSIIRLVKVLLPAAPSTNDASSQLPQPIPPAGGMASKPTDLDV